MLSKKDVGKRRDNFLERAAEKKWESYEQPAAHKLKSLALRV